MLLLPVTEKNAVGEINSWVKDKTKGKIPQIIDNADNFWAMHINAIYFKGAWENEFSTSLTKPDEFTNADGTKTQTDFMNKTSWIPYAETKSAKIIELPYKNRVDKFSDKRTDSAFGETGLIRYRRHIRNNPFSTNKGSGRHIFLMQFLPLYVWRIH